jgi:hypothetical protein
MGLSDGLYQMGYIELVIYIRWAAYNGFYQMGCTERVVYNGLYQMGCIEWVISDGLYRMGFTRWVA